MNDFIVYSLKLFHLLPLYLFSKKWKTQKGETQMRSAFFVPARAIG